MADVVARSHSVQLSRWKNVDARVLAKLQHSGFDVLYKAGFSFRVDNNLLGVLVDRYSIEDQCFIVNGVRITPTLDDVARIMGFPIDGKPVIGLDFNADNSREACERLLGSTELIGDKVKCSLILSNLRDLFKDVDDEISEEELDRHVRGYVLYVIGCLIAPSRDIRTVPSMYLSLLEDVEDIKNCQE